MDGAHPSNALERGLAILELLADERAGLSLTQIANSLSIPKSSAHGLLATLVRQGYVDYDSRSKMYIIDYRVLSLSHRLLHQMETRQRAMPYLEDLYHQTDLLVSFGILSREMVVTIAAVGRGEDGRWPDAYVGRHKPAHCSAKGQVLLAYLPPVELERFLDSYPLAPSTANTITDKGRLRERLASIREQGYYVSKGEWKTERLKALAAPVRNYLGEVIFSVAVSGENLPDGWPDSRAIAAVRETGEKISFSIGYHAASFLREGARNSSVLDNRLPVHERR